MRPLICFERTTVTGKKPGSPEDREAFQERFHGVLRTSVDGYRFDVPGVFQVGKSPPILVLPWVIADSAVVDAVRRDRQDPVTDLLNAIFDIRYLFENAVSSFSTVDHLGAELLIHSYIIRLKDAVERSLQFNYFNSRVESLASIRGRWLHAKDLAKSLTPTSFTCNFDDVAAENPILRCVRFVTTILKNLVASNLNHAFCVEIDRALQSISIEGLSDACFAEALTYIDGSSRFEDWRSLIEFGANLIESRENIVDDAGTCYLFPMDQFFEVLVASLYRAGGGTVRTQVRKSLLGKSFWLLSGRSVSPDDEESRASASGNFNEIQLSTSHHARPDIIYETARDYVIIECKYKPMTFPGVSETSKIVEFSSFGRNDRNQILSFLLSLEPNPAYEGRNIQFVVIYPFIGTDDIRTLDLIFPYASLSIDHARKQVVQTAVRDQRKCWRIRFIGINVEKTLLARGTIRESSISRELIRLSTTLPVISSEAL